MNTDKKETIIDTKAIQDEAQQKRHPVVTVRNLLPSIVTEEGEVRWTNSFKKFWERLSQYFSVWSNSLTSSKEITIATVAAVIIVAALVALYIYGASIAA